MHIFTSEAVYQTSKKFELVATRIAFVIGSPTLLKTKRYHLPHEWHSDLLLTMATTFDHLQRCYLRPKDATFICG